MPRKKIGEVLVDKGLATAEDVSAAIAAQASVGGLLGLILVRMGSLSEFDLLRGLSEHLCLDIQLAEEMPSPQAVQAFLDETRTSTAWWVERQAIAWRSASTGPSGLRKTFCAAVNPSDPLLLGLLEQLCDHELEWRLAPRNLVVSGLEDLRVDSSSGLGKGSSDTKRLRELAEEAPVIDFVNGVFAEALQRRASDVHVEPFEDRFVVRMRVDGIMYNARTAPRASFDAVCSRIKLLSNMDIGERRLPQDGRQAIRVSGQDHDLRVSSLPATWGESLVLRLLGKSTRLPELSELGLDQASADLLGRLVEQPNGIVLVTGPTGSGKTTTIYRLLTALNDGQRKILTVEDPVELDLPGVVQVHVRSEIGLSFAAGLRSILRQDPDVIMVGEIRDPETAKIAVQAALTGHMVISTVHTNSALAAMPRLLDLGLEEYLLADVMRGLVGQRLLRRLCPHCSEAASVGQRRLLAEEARKSLGCDLALDQASWREPRGCSRCGGTGYSGRLGIYEIAKVGQELASAIRRRAGEDALTAIARKNGFATLSEDGVRKAAQGLTSLSEVLRVASGEVIGAERSPGELVG